MLALALALAGCGAAMPAGDGGARDVASAEVRAIALTSTADRSSHFAGTNCASCHSAEGTAPGFFTASGTVVRPDDTPLAGVTLEVRTAPGGGGTLLVSAVTDRSGNFYTTAPLPTQPTFVSLVPATGTRRAMPFPTMSTQCNFCHLGRQRFRI
jgi:cytochrome c5